MQATKTKIEHWREWIQAAILDGWKAQPIYTSTPLEQACEMTRDGFTAHVLARYEYDRGISLWGPDKLAITPPENYDWESIKRGLHVCTNCGKDGEVVKLAFADRVCPDCREKLIKSDAYRRWWV